MNRTVILFLLVFSLLMVIAQPPSVLPGLTWEEVYNFDRCNVFALEFYAKNNELMKTRNIKTFYQSNGENFLVQYLSEMKGNGTETLIDKKNEIAIQMFGTGGGATPMYNAGAFKYPAADELKQLTLIPTDENKLIANLKCRKYTYTHKKIFGEVWLTEDVKLSNDIGVFRACKMAALHNTLSVPGFVMEMTTEDDRGGKTLMKTVSLQKDETYKLDLKGVEMGKAINKVNYFTF
ncbi:MAG: hypothetical protein IPH84_10790 [Bacteroidales bacterium]|nr:hypothetical protein [Bacteroidales bacterium]